MVANILAPTLIELADDLLAHLRAVVLAHHVDRRLAGPETLDARRAADVEQPLVHLLLHAAGRHRDLHAALEPLERLD